MVKNPRQQGLKFEKEIGESLKARFSYVYKFPDYRGFHGYLKGIKFTPHPAPCDFFAVDEGKTYMIECKQTGQTAFSFDAIKPHQMLNLLQAKAAGAVSWFIINFKTDLRMKNHRNECYIVEAERLKNAIDFYTTERRRSVPIRWFREQCVPLLQKKKRWIIP